MKDYSELKRLTEMATPGEWQAYDTHGKRFIESMIGEAHVVCDTPKKQWLKDSEFIAAANPVAVLALIAEVERHQGLYDHMKSMREAYGYESWTEVLTAAEQRKAEVEALRNAAVKVIEMNRQHAEDQYGDSDKAESWSCVTVLRAALGKETGHG